MAKAEMPLIGMIVPPAAGAVPPEAPALYPRGARFIAEGLGLERLTPDGYDAVIDDVVGAIPVHLLAGIWGTMAVPLTNTDTNFVTQFIGVASIGAFVVVASLVFWLVLRFTIGIRATSEEEFDGLDRAELGLEAYPEFGRGSQTI